MHHPIVEAGSVLVPRAGRRRRLLIVDRRDRGGRGGRGHRYGGGGRGGNGGCGAVRADHDLHRLLSPPVPIVGSGQAHVLLAVVYELGPLLPCLHVYPHMQSLGDGVIRTEPLPLRRRHHLRRQRPGGNGGGGAAAGRPGDQDEEGAKECEERKRSREMGCRDRSAAAAAVCASAVHPVRGDRCFDSIQIKSNSIRFDSIQFNSIQFNSIRFGRTGRRLPW